MQHLLQSRSKKISDPAGREVEILEDSQALKIAAESGCSVHDVYVEALGIGIYPYRYIRNRETFSREEQLRLSNARVAVVGAGGGSGGRLFCCWPGLESGILWLWIMIASMRLT